LEPASSSPSCGSSPKGDPVYKPAGLSFRQFIEKKWNEEYVCGVDSARRLAAISTYAAATNRTEWVDR
jgi:hypothetical protein